LDVAEEGGEAVGGDAMSLERGEEAGEEEGEALAVCGFRDAELVRRCRNGNRTRAPQRPAAFISATF